MKTIINRKTKFTTTKIVIKIPKKGMSFKHMTIISQKKVYKLLINKKQIKIY